MQEDDDASEISFIGKGWSFPPGFDKADVNLDLSAGALDIRESLTILLSTSPGERKMQPDYGCDLTPLLFEPVNLSLKKRLSDQIERSILKYEPRVLVEDVHISTTAPSAGKDVALHYSDRDLLRQMMDRVVTNPDEFSYSYKGEKKGEVKDQEKQEALESPASETSSTAGTMVYINVSYLIRRTNTRTNLVYPYYLKEATNI